MGLPRIILILTLLSQSLLAQLTTTNGGSVILLQEGDYQNWIDQGTSLVTENPDNVVIELPEPDLGPIQIDHPVDIIDIPIDVDTGLGTGTSELTNYKLDEIISAIRAGDQADDTEELEKIIEILETPVVPQAPLEREKFYQIDENDTSESAFFPTYQSTLSNWKDRIKDIVQYDKIESLPDLLPDSEEQELKWHIIDVGEYTFEIDLTTQQMSTFVEFLRIGLTLVIVWGLCWVFFKLNAIIITT